MKRFVSASFAIISILATAGVANAQRRSTVSGVVADFETRQPLIGVVVGFAPVGDSVAINNIVSGAGGTFSTGLNSGEWNVGANLLGYEMQNRTVEVAGARTVIDTLFLSAGIEIDAVVKRAVALRTSVSGDTLIYNADSYKVAGDANVSGLLEKMPGIKVEDGAVEAQGEAIRKVLIDGKEFFGEDVNAAISSLPAEVVKSIEVFDKLSDNAEFTGIDDGEGYKAINITTREAMRQGVMGQVSALYGVEPPEQKSESWRHYGMVSGNVNIFRGDAKITVGGTVNNLNERHFTSEDILGAGDNNGFGNVGRLQLNYIDMWGKKDQWNFEGSYTYGIVDSENESTVDREYFQTDDARYRNYYSESFRESLNQNHGFNARIDFKPNEYQELRIRPSFRFQGNDSSRNGSEIYYPVDGSDNILLENWNNSDEKGWAAGLNINYRVRLGKPGRTLSFFLNGAYDPDDRTRRSYSEREDGTSIRQFTPSRNTDSSFRGGVTYTEPISKSSLVNLDYSVGYNYSDNDRKAYLWNDELDDYDMTTIDESLSGVYNSGYLTHRVGPGYRMQKGKTMLALGVAYQHSSLESTRVLPMPSDLKTGFDNVTYSALLRSEFGEGSSLRFFLNSRTQNPGVGNLQDVVDLANVQNIRKGNPTLRPAYNNSVSGRLILPDTEKGRTLAFNIGGSYTTNAIVERTIRESPGYQVTDSEGNVVETLDGVGSYTEPVNMDGAWNARFGIDYGFPVSFLRSNLNLDADVSHRQVPSQIGKWSVGMAAPTFAKNLMRATEVEGGISLGSNISEKVDFRVGYDIEYNIIRNTMFDRSNSEYLEHTVRADFKFVLPAYFTISGNLRFRNYNSISGDDFNEQYFIANAGIGKKVFRSKQGEVSIFVNDIFNQNIGFGREAYAQWIQNSTYSIIGRYAGVKFTWNIRNFGKKGSQNLELYDIGGREGHNHGGFGGRGRF